MIDELDDSPKMFGRIHSLKRHPSGKMQIQIRGEGGKICSVKTSTNLTDWETVGVATVDGDGLFEFDGAESPAHQWRFYRVVIP